MSTTVADAMTILAAVAAMDEHDVIWWRCDGEYAPITFFVRANDLFYWACSDGEELTIENLAVFQQAFRDCDHGQELFCARVRGMRPQQPYYKAFSAAEKVLFDACGPERDPK